jgi:nicotinate-nucleotide pyrophosphorylase (carboxylating)
MGERTALNFIQRMSGIATRTNSLVKILDGTNIKILDTRKTAPGLRLIDKYSVKAGGGENHRIGLFDMVLIKDNHIAAAGSITAAVAKVREKWDSLYKIEVETSNLAEVREALECSPDVIMLDNMDKNTMREAVSMINKKSKIELSGNMDEAKLENLKDLDVDYISIGALTHSVKAFDFSMKF